MGVVTEMVFTLLNDVEAVFYRTTRKFLYKSIKT